MSHTVMVPSLAPDIMTFGLGLPVSSAPTQVTVPCSSCRDCFRLWSLTAFSHQQGKLGDINFLVWSSEFPTKSTGAAGRISTQPLPWFRSLRLAHY